MFIPAAYCEREVDGIHDVSVFGTAIKKTHVLTTARLHKSKNNENTIRTVNMEMPLIYLDIPFNTCHNTMCCYKSYIAFWFS